MSGAALPSPSRSGGRLRALVLCPGRGSYGRESLGQLQALPPGPARDVVDAFDAARGARGLPTTRALDAEPALRPALHAAGEHASALTAACSLADVAQIDPARFEIVGVCGNSMGWYTALTAGGALPLADGVQLIETFGGWQRDNVIGGQVLLPLTDEEWRPEPWRLDRVNDLVQRIPDLHWSIRLGGQAVLGGTEAALAALSAAVPAEERAGVRFPLRLPLHSAFHTPLMAATAEKAQALRPLGWRAPAVTLIDGQGSVWSPRSADPGALAAWTLGPQVDQTFDFTTMLRVALGELAPEVIILPGPGANLGSAVAQVMIGLGWQGLRDRQAFLRRQAERPLVLSMGRPDQRALVRAP
jgi:acyl transferase domain-containing protein